MPINSEPTMQPTPSSPETMPQGRSLGKLQGNYRNLWAKLCFPTSMLTGETPQATQARMQVDLPRVPFVDFHRKPPDKFAKDWIAKAKNTYLQGDITGSIFSSLLWQRFFDSSPLFNPPIASPELDDLRTQYREARNKTELRFGYYNDKNQVSGFSLIYSHLDPSLWVIAIIRNAATKRKNRVISLFGPDILFQGTWEHDDNTVELTGSKPVENIAEEVGQALQSESIQAFLLHLFEGNTLNTAVVNQIMLGVNDQCTANKIERHHSVVDTDSGEALPIKSTGTHHFFSRNGTALTALITTATAAVGFIALAIKAVIPFGILLAASPQMFLIGAGFAGLVAIICATKILLAEKTYANIAAYSTFLEKNPQEDIIPSYSPASFLALTPSGTPSFDSSPTPPLPYRNKPTGVDPAGDIEEAAGSTTAQDPVQPYTIQHRLPRV